MVNKSQMASYTRTCNDHGLFYRILSITEPGFFAFFYHTKLFHYCDISNPGLSTVSLISS